MVNALRCCFAGVKKVSMLYFLIIEHRCTLRPMPSKEFTPVSSSSTSRFASESLLRIEDYFAIAFISLKTLLSRFRPFVKLLIRLMRCLELLTSKLEARTSIEVLWTGAGCYSLPFFALKASCRVIQSGSNCLYIWATLSALMLSLPVKSSFKSSSFRSVSSAVAKSSIGDSALYRCS